MTIKSIMQEALNTASTYGQSALDKAKWGVRYVSEGFNTHVAPRVSLLFSNGLQRLQSLPQSTRAFVATPVGKGAIGASLLGVLGFAVYIHRRRSHAAEAAEKAKAKATEKAKAEAVEKTKIDQKLHAEIKDLIIQKVRWNKAYHYRYSNLQNKDEVEKAKNALDAQRKLLNEANNRVIDTLITKLEKEAPEDATALKAVKITKDQAIETFRSTTNSFPKNADGYCINPEDALKLDELQTRAQTTLKNFEKIYDPLFQRVKKELHINEEAIIADEKDSLDAIDKKAKEDQEAKEAKAAEAEAALRKDLIVAIIALDQEKKNLYALIRTSPKNQALENQTRIYTEAHTKVFSLLIATFEKDDPQSAKELQDAANERNEASKLLENNLSPESQEAFNTAKTKFNKVFQAKSDSIYRA